MELSDLRAIVREDRFADVYDNPAPDEDSRRWSDAFIDRTLNEGQRAACRATDLLFDNTSTLTEIEILGDTASYQLDPLITRVDALIFEGAPLRQITERELVTEEGETWRAETGPPEAFLIRGRTLTFFPVPILSGSATMEVYRLPLVDMAADGNEPEIPEEYHEALCFFAEHRGYLRKDEDTYDPKKAQDRLLRFQAVFGIPESAQIRQHRLEQPKGLSLRPKSTCGRRRAWAP